MIVSCPVDLPDALPARGVLVLQIYPGWIDVYHAARAKFLENVIDVYAARGTPTTDKYLIARSGQALTQDEELLQRIRKDAEEGAVLVHFKMAGQPDEHEPLLRELEQELVHFLTKRGLIVSLIRARHPTRAEALVHKPLPSGELSRMKISFDLKPYLENLRIGSGED
jgi:hypothetical protein